MARLLLLFALALLLTWLWRRLRNRPPRRPAPPTQAEPMVRCQHCGLHVPREEALGSAPHWYCSQAHLEADRAKQDS
ncbi:PP0621 family protein [Pseudomonas sp. NW5]|uniref:PP0621 family protein n=1 Tax=Pseudomonas sp. NW5 TaxID=2934934 RepID=UPI002021C4CC|nr:PP0621 family protein [Pseudomonas sp. NW5]MCL7461227.1 hypothetical protein [Pseudomonas sp. NW5]